MGQGESCCSQSLQKINQSEQQQIVVIQTEIIHSSEKKKKKIQQKKNQNSENFQEKIEINYFNEPNPRYLSYEPMLSIVGETEEISFQSDEDENNQQINKKANLLNQNENTPQLPTLQSRKIPFNEIEKQSEIEMQIKKQVSKRIKYIKETNQQNQIYPYKGRAIDSEKGRFFYIKTILKQEIQDFGIDLEKLKQFLSLQFQYPNNFQKFLKIQKGDQGEMEIISQLEEGQSLDIVRGQFQGIRSYLKEFIFKSLISLYHIHQSKLVHGNLKMENLFFVAETGEIKLFDLNFWILSEKTIKQKILNEYTAPEIFLADQNAHEFFTPQSDVWALGVIILNLYLGFSPWTDSQKKPIPVTFFKSLFKKQKIFSIPHSIQGDFRDFLEKIIVLDPEKRFSCKELLSHEYLKEKSSQSNIFFQSSISHETAFFGESQLNGQTTIQENYFNKQINLANSQNQLKNYIVDQQQQQIIQFSSFSHHSSDGQGSNRAKRATVNSQCSFDKSPIYFSNFQQGKYSPQQGFQQAVENIENSINLVNEINALSPEKNQLQMKNRFNSDSKKQQAQNQLNQSESSKSNLTNSEYFISENNLLILRNPDSEQNNGSVFQFPSQNQVDQNQQQEILRKQIELLIESEFQNELNKGNQISFQEVLLQVSPNLASSLSPKQDDKQYFSSPINQLSQDSIIGANLLINSSANIISQQSQQSQAENILFFQESELDYISDEFNSLNDPNSIIEH